MAVDYYVDNNETIYASENAYNAILAGNSLETKIGLQDLTDLTGQSTVFVNKIRFEFEGTCLDDEPNYSWGHIVCGIAPEGYATTLSFFDRYQTIKGWPFKMAKKYYHVANSNFASGSRNKIRMVHTFTPRDALLVNREQEIVLCTTNRFGASIAGLNSIVLQLKRGD